MHAGMPALTNNHTTEDAMNTKTLKFKTLTLALALSAGLAGSAEALAGVSANTPSINTCQATVCDPLSYLRVLLNRMLSLESSSIQ